MAKDVIDYFCEAGWLDPVDIAFARAWEIDPRLRLLLCHLFRAVRQGHVCLLRERGAISPDPEELWPLFFAGDTTNLPDWKELRKELQTAWDLFSPSWPQPFVCEENRLYFSKMHRYERLLLSHLDRLLSSPPRWEISFKEETAGPLLPEQREAIRHALGSSLTVITGGPGTGKTYTAGHLLRQYWLHLSPQQQEQCEIIIAAPTGKAASHLEQSLQKWVGTIPGFPNLRAQTLHRLLGLGGALRWNAYPAELSADLLLIDEGSMIDLPMMAYLLQRIKPGARLILLGDADQLPSVDIGGVFGDLVARYPEHTQHLRQCLRTERESLQEIAAAVREGRDPDFPFVPFPESGLSLARAQEEIVEKILGHIPPTEDLSEEGLLTAMSQFRALTPLRKGPFGVDALNETIRKRLWERTRDGAQQATPIIVTRNDEAERLYNGDGGILVQRVQKGGGAVQMGDYALFPDPENPGAYRRIPALLLPPVSLGYVLSVHKSQGSEYSEVFFLLPPGCEYFGRELIYTAVTRAKQTLHLCTRREIFTKALDKKSRRFSGIRNRRP